MSLDNNSYGSLMKIEQIARSVTWDPEQVDSSDLLWYIPKHTIIGKESYRESSLSIRKLPEKHSNPRI